ncbi:unnamed protein product [[Candida] boidinii]|nr:unnamed protein product [[Candida] boidinii]
MSSTEKFTNSDPEAGLFENAPESTSSLSMDKEQEAAEEMFGETGNVLSQYTEEQVMDMGRNYARKQEFDQELFAKAAAISRDPTGFNSMTFLSETEKQDLHRELTQKWHLPRTLYWLIIMCSMGACIQGMDESVINGANLYFPKGLGIGSGSDRDTWLVGLVNCGPYLCCSTISCWMTDALNHRFGRKGTIIITCVISAATCIWQGCTNTWWHLFIARFFLGFGIGPKSTTVPVYSAECVPARIRGALPSTKFHLMVLVVVVLPGD